MYDSSHLSIGPYNHLYIHLSYLSPKKKAVTKTHNDLPPCLQYAVLSVCPTNHCLTRPTSQYTQKVQLTKEKVDRLANAQMHID